MKTYQIQNGPVRLYTGLLKLTDDQAAVRMHALEPAKGKGLFQVTAEVCFKAGEVIGMADPVPKALAAYFAKVAPAAAARPADPDPGEA